MSTYEWMRFGTLRKHIGIPMYAGDVLITQWVVVWWWPINWVVTAIVLPRALYNLWRERKSSN